MRLKVLLALLLLIGIPLRLMAQEPPVIPVGLDAYRQWERWPYQRIGARAYMRSTYDRTGGNEGADASHFLYQTEDDFNVSLDVEGPGMLYFVRTNHWHGSPWHYMVDGQDNLVQETTTATPDKPVAGSTFLPAPAFPNPLAWTWADTKGADLSWVPIGFTNSFQMAYSRTHYGTGYYIYQQFTPGAKLSQPLRTWKQEVLRLYDEWDSLGKRVAQGTATAIDQEQYRRSVATAEGPVPLTQRPLSFRLLSSLADVTLGSTNEMLRVLANEVDDVRDPATLQAELEPRLSCAIRWASEFLLEDERTVINTEFDAAVYAELSEEDRRGLHLLLDQLDQDWSLPGLTSLIYGVPKQLLNLPLDTKPTEELKKVQRRFFIVLYRLLCASDTGPRLPTLFLALKQDRLRALLGHRP